MAPGADELIERFLATGRVTPGFRGWPGDATARREGGTAALRSILVRIVTWRAGRAPLRLGPPPADAPTLVRQRTRPAVEGLFDAATAASVLNHLPGRVRVVTPLTFPTLIGDLPLERAWDLANLVLDHIGAPTLADDIPRLDALTAGTLAFVLPSAFAPRADADVVLHECVHVLLASRRGDFGLDAPDELLLPVPVTQHESVAYAVEAWGCAERTGAAPPPSAGRAEDARVDGALYATLLDAARAGGWNGLKAGLAALR